MAAEVPPEERGVLAPHQGPQPRVPVLGREVPITSGYKNQQELTLSETQGYRSPRKFLLKGLRMT